ncbi:atp-binding cassette superfamily [Plasmopara halstedii]|uniref:Atp-binding cassette superfamily n=1 Tax=Plasmopara halstedii TaxID=4781 RepID=A0A0P1AFB0_PLAHL|nr:atp-binding cassette superfamily [Plasmopara halstedii]CEG39520.1 atp-binding cassette superfamily [Plasmopara halstedii]|eukprot:XP_024575889.1 atp-binding cassette superfamily [Plasmopara halstedii]
MERRHDDKAGKALSDTGDNSVGDVVPEMKASMTTVRLPRFGSRRHSSNSNAGDLDRPQRTKSMFPEPQQLTKDDLTSADALMAGGVFTMNSTLSTVIENALGQPIPGLEVRFRDLELSAEVPMIKGGSLEVPTLFNELQQGLSNMCFSSNKMTIEKKILRGISGVFRPGRLTLVLGQPGSGKSSLMKVLANRFHMTKNITLKGEIDYSGKARDSILRELPRYVAYANQVDDHYPRLTVKETFEFAHRCCAGAGMEPWGVDALKNCSPEQHDHALEVLNAHHKFAAELTIKKLGLDNCKDTAVGNAMLRGVSGGERKRVTTGEMMFGLKRLQLLDEISTGLDSAATYDICKSMKSAARNFNATIVISLLQPSPEVFELFDDVLLMNDGTIMFHGKIEDVVPYFESMGFHCPPRKDVADYLLDLGTDKQDAYVVGGSVPFHSDEFASRFQQSSIYQATLKRLDVPVEDSAIFADFTPFRQTFAEDLVTLLRREFTLITRDTTYVMGRVFMVLLMGLLYGSTFWQMDDSNSQLTLGLLFSVAMFLSLSQASQVATYMEARSIFYKQRGANFFRSSAYVLASSFSLIPMSILETVVFGAITYWFGGYVDEVDRFLIFLITLFFCQMWFSSFFFFLSAASPNLTIAQPMMMVAVLFFMIFGGFLIARDDLPDYLIWIYWLDPFAWCIRSLSVNQYLASKFDVCVYNGIDYCTQFNLTVGEYSLGVFDLQTGSEWIWYGWAFFVATYIILVLCAYLVLEYKRYEGPENVAIVAPDEDGRDQTTYNQMPRTPKENESAVRIHVNESADGVPTISIPVQPTGRGISMPITLAFHDLWYSVPLPGGTNDEQIDLLKGVSGFALPGTMTALMGSSGAGKTTLMDVIAGRKTGGKIKGKILLNGHAANDLAIRRCTGYCEQMDIHSDSATVREALIFSAMLRQDASVPTARKMESVNECIELLELGPIADKIIRGMSTEQMKRVTIGVELAAQPSIIFMDEPTSGLDARSAKLIMNGVRKIADSGRTIICTIHQPSTEVFNLFDSLLLLRRGGRMVFFGQLGEDSKNLINYFEAFSNVNPIKPGYNPATWMLECIGAGVGGGKGDPAADPSQPTDFADRFAVSDQKLMMEEDLNQEGVLFPSPSLPELKFDTKRASNGYVQFDLLCRRFFRMYWRTPTYNLTRLMVSVVLACVFAIIYQGTDYNTYSGANAGIGLIFVSTTFLGIISFNSVMPVAADERTAFYRERASQTYNALWYFIAGTLVEIPYIFFSTLLFTIIFYPSVGFDGFITFFYYWLVVSMNALVFVYLGQLLVYALPSVAVATIIGALLCSIFMLYAGYNPPTDSIPTGYMWVHWISPPTYSIAILVALVFADCSDGKVGCDLMQEAPPTIGNMTIKDYVENVFDMKHDDIWRNAMILVALIVVFRVLALISLRYISHLKR